MIVPLRLRFIQKIYTYSNLVFTIWLLLHLVVLVWYEAD